VKTDCFYRFKSGLVTGLGLFALGATAAVAFDEQGLSVMQETIQQSGSQGGITGENARPVLESYVGGDDDRASLVSVW
jgi:hypothetical protein